MGYAIASLTGIPQHNYNDVGWLMIIGKIIRECFGSEGRDSPCNQGLFPLPL